MTSIQIGEYVMLRKSIKREREDTDSNNGTQFNLYKTESVIFPNEMICRVCTCPADIPITEKIDGFTISSAIRRVSNVCITETDPYPKYVCKRCLEELKVALTFRNKCEVSDSLFRQSQPIKSEIQISPERHNFSQIIHQMNEDKQSQLDIKNKGQSKKSNKKEINTPISQNTDISVKNTFLQMKTAKCRKCNIKFDSKVQLLKHRQLRDCLAPPCPICGKIVSDLKRHKINVHLQADKSTCDICGKTLHSSTALRYHKMLHSETCDFACSICPYKCKKKAYLALHMRIHTGEKRYLCSQCPAKFVFQTNLRKHLSTHAGKKFECDKCKKRFRVRKRLQEHYDAAHLNVRYRCTICGRDLSTRRQLLSHELRVHKREKHKLFDEVRKVVINDEND